MPSVISNLVSTAVSSSSSPITVDGLWKSVTSVDSGGASVSCTVTQPAYAGSGNYDLRFALRPGQTMDLFKWKLFDANIQVSGTSTSTAPVPAVLVRSYKLL